MAMVYMATNTANEKRYIGRTGQLLRNRRYQVDCDARKGRHPRRPFYNAIRKYGIDMFRFTVLLADLDDGESLEEEVRLIELLKPEYNVKKGASGQRINPKRTIRPKRRLPPAPVNKIAGEQWRPISGYDFYEVSSLGRVKSLPRGRRDALGETRYSAEQLLAQSPDGNGRPVVYLSAGGRKKTARVHQLVAEAFLGPRPPGLVVCHRNDDNTDNDKENLFYATQLDNIRQRGERGRTARGGGTHARAKLTPEAVREIRRLKPTHSYYKLGDIFGVSHTSIEQVIKGKTWSHVE